MKLPSKKPTETWTSDKDYMAAMVKDHEKDHAEFQKEAKEGTDPDIKEFAEANCQDGPRTPRPGEGNSKQAAIVSAVAWLRSGTS